jgi:thioredoxin 1
MKAMEITAQELNEKIENGEKLIVDFWATWCGPCKMLKPIFDKTSLQVNESDMGVKMYTMDVDANRDLAVSLGIRSVPTIKVFNKGEVVDTKVGVIQENEIMLMAKELVNG